MRFLTIFCLITVIIAACGSSDTGEVEMGSANTSETGLTRESGAEGDPGVTGDYSLGEFHRVPIPEEYAGLTNPITVDDTSLARGKEAFILYCAVCHGETGRGDGPGAENLYPPVPAIADTQRELSDDFLYFRIRDGGVIEPFNSAMPMWEEILDVRTIWDLINYIRSLDGVSGNG